MGSSPVRDVGDVGELFRLHGPMVYGRALRLLGCREDAEEALQEVFVRLMRSLDEFEHRSSLSTWLYQITTNYCLDILNQRGRRRRLFAQNVAVPDDQPEGLDTSELLHLRRLLSEADAEQARAVIYVYLDGMSHEQTAEVMGVSRRTVGNLVERFLAWAQKRGGLEKN